jgi:hypothetical protein
MYREPSTWAPRPVEVSLMRSFTSRKSASFAASLQRSKDAIVPDGGEPL